MRAQTAFYNSRYHNGQRKHENYQALHRIVSPAIPKASLRRPSLQLPLAGEQVSHHSGQGRCQHASHRDYFYSSSLCSL